MIGTQGDVGAVCDSQLREYKFQLLVPSSYWVPAKGGSMCDYLAEMKTKLHIDPNEFFTKLQESMEQMPVTVPECATIRRAGDVDYVLVQTFSQREAMALMKKVSAAFLAVAVRLAPSLDKDQIRKYAELNYKPYC